MLRCVDILWESGCGVSPKPCLIPWRPLLFPRGQRGGEGEYERVARKRAARRQPWRPLFLLSGAIALLIACLEICMASEEKPAANMRDVHSHFRDCLQPFSRGGWITDHPVFLGKEKWTDFRRSASRMVWIRCQRSGEERILSDFARAFESCMPSSAQQLHGRISSRQSLLPSIHGGRDGSQIIVRPYGGEGPPIFDDDGW